MSSMCSPLRSTLDRISPIRPRRTASGLMTSRVDSSATPRPSCSSSGAHERGARVGHSIERARYQDEVVLGGVLAGRLHGCRHRIELLHVLEAPRTEGGGNP